MKRILEKLCCVDSKKRMDADEFMGFSMYGVYNETALLKGNVTLRQEDPGKLGLSLEATLDLKAMIMGEKEVDEK